MSKLNNNKKSKTLNFFQVNNRSTITTFVDLVLKLFLTKSCLYIKAYHYFVANAIEHIEIKGSIGTKCCHPFHPTVAFHIETSHLICAVNQITGFCIKCNTGLKWVNPFRTKAPHYFNPYQCSGLENIGTK